MQAWDAEDDDQDDDASVGSSGDSSNDAKMVPTHEAGQTRDDVLECDECGDKSTEAHPLSLSFVCV